MNLLICKKSLKSWEQIWIFLTSVSSLLRNLFYLTLLFLLNAFQNKLLKFFFKCKIVPKTRDNLSSWEIISRWLNVTLCFEEGHRIMETENLSALMHKGFCQQNVFIFGNEMMVAGNFFPSSITIMLGHWLC